MNKVNCVILGATGGIGSALTASLSAQGARVLALGRDQAKLAQLATLTGVTTQQLDALDAPALEAAIAAFAEQVDSLNGLVNCIGSIMLKPCHLLTDNDWQQTLNTNLTTSFYAVRSAIKPMRNNGGSIVLLTTTAAHVGLPNHEAIAAAKHGIIGLAQSAAASYAKTNIRVNCVAPGLVETSLTERITASERGLQMALSNHPLGRIGQPADIVAAIEFFLNPVNNWVTGQSLAVDGGCSQLKA